jgi:hypothetical protein
MAQNSGIPIKTLKKIERGEFVTVRLPSFTYISPTSHKFTLFSEDIVFSAFPLAEIEIAPDIPIWVTSFDISTPSHRGVQVI